MYWIDSSGYYEGDERPGSVAVPQRPSPDHEWNGTQWVLVPPSIDRRVEAVLARRGLTLQTEWQLYGHIGGILALATLQGKTEPQAYAENTGYRNAKDMAVEIAAIRAGS